MSLTLEQQVAIAVRACEAKKAHDLSILRMEPGSFTDYMVLASVANAKQGQAIADEISHKLTATGVRPNSIEGFSQAEWILLDYVDYVIHIFFEPRRAFYNLDRLWKPATKISLAQLERGKAKAKKPVKKSAGKPARKDKKKSAAMKSARKRSITRKPVKKIVKKKPAAKRRSKKK